MHAKWGKHSDRFQFFFSDMREVFQNFCGSNTFKNSIYSKLLALHEVLIASISGYTKFQSAEPACKAGFWAFCGE